MGMHFSFHFVSIEWIKESTGARDLAWTIGLWGQCVEIDTFLGLQNRIPSGPYWFFPPSSYRAITMLSTYTGQWKCRSHRLGGMCRSNPSKDALPECHQYVSLNGRYLHSPPSLPVSGFSASCSPATVCPPHYLVKRPTLGQYPGLDITEHGSFNQQILQLNMLLSRDGSIKLLQKGWNSVDNSRGRGKFGKIWTKSSKIYIKTQIIFQVQGARSPKSIPAAEQKFFIKYLFTKPLRSIYSGSGALSLNLLTYQTWTKICAV